MQAKIRNAQLQKVPYMLVIGGREAEANAVAVRLRSGEDLGAMPIEEFLSLIQPVIETKSLDLQQPRETTT
jgi:threonyl-tRNA synthetase